MDKTEDTFSDSIQGTVKPVKASDTIKITVRIPENVTEAIKRQKINRIYDILVSAKNSPVK